MNIFQIPKSSEKTFDFIIGVIDASGSMEKHWSWLADHWNAHVSKENAITIVFDTIAQVVESNMLDHNINYHGGGGTNITKAFELFESKLDELPNDKIVTVLFVSDGRDNNISGLEKRLKKLNGNITKRKINFLTLGIGEQFPTFIAMKLRELYHHGDETIPAVFLIEYATEKAFTIKFELLKKYMKFHLDRKITPPVCVFPWREYSETVYEDAWILTADDEVAIDGEVYELSEFNLNLKGIQELFRSWSQAIHLESLKCEENVKSKAMKAIAMMEEIIDRLREDKTIDVLDIEKYEKQTSFKDKALANLIKRNYGRIKWFYDDMKAIAEGDVAKTLNEYEAAKKIGTGTIVGNYMQKTLNLKKLATSDFKRIKEEFKKIYENTTITPYDNQEASIITLETQKHVFLEPDFIEAIDMCHTQFDLVDSFPLIGLALKIKRLAQCSENPWDIEVQKVAKVHNVIDSTSLNKNNGVMEFNIGEDDKEIVNCVLPIFYHTDEDLSPLINSQLYHLLMTHNVTRKADNLFDEAYLSLLGHTLIHMIVNKQDTEWWSATFYKLSNTLRIITYKNYGFLKYAKEMSGNIGRELSYLKDSENNNMVKHITGMMANNIYAPLSAEKLRENIDLLMLRLYFEAFRDDITLLNKFINCMAKTKQDTNKDTLSAVEEKITGRFETYYTRGELKRDFKKLYLDLYLGKSQEPQWTISSGLSSSKIKSSIEKLARLRVYMTNEACSNGDHQKLIVLAASSKQFSNVLYHYENFTASLYEKLESNLVDKLATGLNKKEDSHKAEHRLINSKHYKNMENTLLSLFAQWFRSIHNKILPISPAKLKEINSTKNLNLTLCQETMLVKNACMAPKCSFYLQSRNKFHHHMDIWGTKLPKNFHRTVCANFQEPEDDVYRIFKELNNNFNAADYETTDAEVKAYIRCLKIAYKDIKK